MREGEKRFRALATTANDAVVVYDAAGIISFWNKAAQDIFGYTEEEVLGKSIRMLIPEEKRDTCMARLRPGEPSGKSTLAGRITEAYGARMDGSVFPLELSLASWKTASGDFYTGIIQDITWRKKIEEELRAHNEELAAFAHSLSHDLLNPLSMIEGYAQLALKARDGGDAPLEAASLHSIITATERARALVNSMLEYAEAGRPMGKVKRVDLGTIVQEVMEEFGDRIEREGADIEVSPDLPVVSVDPVRLHQVLSNLLSNSLKFRRGEAAPRVRIGAELEPDRIILFVRDEGPGIPTEELESVFEPFKRIHVTDTPGLGIGLSTVRRAVKAWGGIIWVESEPDRGSIFRFTIPRRRPPHT